MPVMDADEPVGKEAAGLCSQWLPTGLARDGISTEAVFPVGVSCGRPRILDGNDSRCRHNGKDRMTGMDCRLDDGGEFPLRLFGGVSRLERLIGSKIAVF